jgi:hypothetical protein
VTLLVGLGPARDPAPRRIGTRSRASYTDRQRAAHDYIAWLMAVQGVEIPAYAAYRLCSRLVPVVRPFAALGLLGSVLSVAAYALVLWAQTRAEPAPIAALRESSVKPCSCGNKRAGQWAGGDPPCGVGRHIGTGILSAGCDRSALEYDHQQYFSRPAV